MRFATHSELEGKHAFLSASKYHWIRYTDEKMAETYKTAIAAMKGTQLHEFGKTAINLGVKLPGNGQTLSRYVNDAIGYRMTTEQVLYYSDNSFGTADAIAFRANMLRIHDLKTGVTPTSFNQLEVYAALFCLEYGFKPANIKMELRIYQNDDVEILEPDVDDITHIMDRIITFDRMIEDLKAEAFS